MDEIKISVTGMDITFADPNWNDSKIDKSYFKKEMTKHNRPFVPIAIVFIFFNSLIIFARNFLESQGFDREVMMYANLLLFLITLGGFFFQKRGLHSANPQAFVRGVYASMMFKLFICMVAVLIYFFLFKSRINKLGVFAAMGMYIVYTVVEVAALMKVAKRKHA